MLYLPLFWIVGSFFNLFIFALPIGAPEAFAILVTFLVPSTGFFLDFPPRLFQPWLRLDLGNGIDY